LHRSKYTEQHTIRSSKSGIEYNIPSVSARYNITRTVATESDDNYTSSKTDLKKCLTPLQYHVTQEKGTEYPFSGEYTDLYEAGTYLCVVCKKELFSSKTKYDSGCGWPAFSDVTDTVNIKLNKDTSCGMTRTEVACAGCGAHLGHVFDDGPKPSGRRYCINSASLMFEPVNSKI
jgi:peptide-methionine (R)-S-oxide reductase